jgi:hypothetical protein
MQMPNLHGVDLSIEMKARPHVFVIWLSRAIACLVETKF